MTSPKDPKQCECGGTEGYHTPDCPKVTPPISSSRLGDEGLTGNLYGINVLPNTAHELVEAIQKQKDLPEAEAMEMADYLDERYHMRPYVQTANTPNPDSEGELDINEDTSDGYHTFKELYEFRLLYNAALFNEWANLPNNPYDVHKSHTHSDGEPAFGGGWFVVVAELPTGQITNHYEDKDWGLFRVPVTTMANEWDGHSPSDVAERLRSMIEQTSDAVGSGDDAKSEQHRTKQ